MIAVSGSAVMILSGKLQMRKKQVQCWIRRLNRLRKYCISSSFWAFYPPCNWECNRTSDQRWARLMSSPAHWLWLVGMHLESQIFSAMRALRHHPSPTPSIYKWWSEALIRERLAPQHESNRWQTLDLSPVLPGLGQALLPFHCTAFPLAGLTVLLRDCGPLVNLWVPFSFLRTA